MIERFEDKVLKEEDCLSPVLKRKYKILIIRIGEKFCGYIYHPDGDVAFETERGAAVFVDLIDNAKSQIMSLELLHLVKKLMEKTGLEISKGE